LAFTEESGDRDLLQRLANSLAYYWYVRGLLSEGRSWLEHALQHKGEAAPPLVGRMLCFAASLAEHQGDYDIARKYGEESLRLSRQSGVVVDVISSLNALAGIAAAEDDLKAARQMVDEALRLAQVEGDERWIEKLMANIGEIEMRAGRFGKALLGYDEALRRARALAHSHGIVQATVNRGTALIGLGRLGEAIAEYSQGIEAAESAGYTELIPWATTGLAAAAARCEAAEEAALLLGYTEHLLRMYGYTLPRVEKCLHEEATKTAKGMIAQEWFELEFEKGLSLARNEGISDLLTAVGALEVVAEHDGRHD